MKMKDMIEMNQISKEVLLDLIRSETNIYRMKVWLILLDKINYKVWFNESNV